MKKIPKRLRGEREKLKGGRVPDCVTRVAVGRGVACELLPSGLYQSTAATVTKTYRMGSLNNRNLFPPVLEAGSPRLRFQ